MIEAMPGTPRCGAHDTRKRIRRCGSHPGSRFGAILPRSPDPVTRTLDTNGVSLGCLATTAPGARRIARAGLHDNHDRVLVGVVLREGLLDLRGCHRLEGIVLVQDVVEAGVAEGELLEAARPEGRVAHLIF